MKNKNKKIFIAVCAAAIVLAILAGAAIYAIKTDLFWRITDRWSKNELEVRETEWEYELISFDDLKNDLRVTVDQSLMLINAEHMLDDEFSPELAEYKSSGVMMNKAILAPYAELSAAVSEKFSQKLYVSSSVRSRDEQEVLYLEDPTTAQKPGASEHESGLCLDVYVAYYAGAGFLDSDVGKYVNSHCYEYGFIIRYPSYGVNETGIKFEPWHIRYVGKIHADIIYNNKLTLESYIASLEAGKFYSCKEYIITRQELQGGMLAIPVGCSDYVISPDNTGYYIITAKRSA